MLKCCHINSTVRGLPFQASPLKVLTDLTDQPGAITPGPLNN